jgi:hypothetical protein
MITVYYSAKPTFNKVNDKFNTIPLLNMLDEGLVPVYNDLKKYKSKSLEDDRSMFVCRSFLQYTKNMYMMTNPYDISVRVEKTKIFNLGNKELDILYANRMMQIDEAYNINYSPGYLFFSEQPVELEMLSPFMHKSNFCKNGYIVPGSFDISKWFRPINPSLQFYDNSDKIINSPMKDPLMYINFKTKETVKLKKFFITKELEDIIYATTIYKRHDPNRSLSYLYDKFTKAGLHKKTLKLIKENLI